MTLEITPLTGTASENVQLSAERPGRSETLLAGLAAFTAGWALAISQSKSGLRVDQLIFWVLGGPLLALVLGQLASLLGPIPLGPVTRVLFDDRRDLVEVERTTARGLLRWRRQWKFPQETLHVSVVDRNGALFLNCSGATHFELPLKLAGTPLDTFRRRLARVLDREDIPLEVVALPAPRGIPESLNAFHRVEAWRPGERIDVTTRHRKLWAALFVVALQLPGLSAAVVAGHVPKPMSLLAIAAAVLGALVVLVPTRREIDWTRRELVTWVLGFPLRRRAFSDVREVCVRWSRAAGLAEVCVVSRGGWILPLVGFAAPNQQQGLERLSPFAADLARSLGVPRREDPPPAPPRLLGTRARPAKLETRAEWQPGTLVRANLPQSGWTTAAMSLGLFLVTPLVMVVTPNVKSGGLAGLLMLAILVCPTLLLSIISMYFFDPMLTIDWKKRTLVAASRVSRRELDFEKISGVFHRRFRRKAKSGEYFEVMGGLIVNGEELQLLELSTTHSRSGDAGDVKAKQLAEALKVPLSK